MDLWADDDDGATRAAVSVFDQLVLMWEFSTSQRRRPAHLISAITHGRDWDVIQSLSRLSEAQTSGSAAARGRRVLLRVLQAGSS